MYTLVPAENAITVAEREGVCDSEIVNVLVDTIHNSDAIRCMVLLADMVQTSTSNIDRQFLLLNVKLLLIHWFNCCFNRYVRKTLIKTFTST